MKIFRNDILITRMEPTVGSEQRKTRPTIVLQNNSGNKFSKTIIVATITTRIYEKKYPVNVEFGENDSDLDFAGTVQLNQIKTIDKTRIIRKVGKMHNPIKIDEVNKALKISFALD